MVDFVERATHKDVDSVKPVEDGAHTAKDMAAERLPTRLRGMPLRVHFPLVQEGAIIVLNDASVRSSEGKQGLGACNGIDRVLFLVVTTEIICQN